MRARRGEHLTIAPAIAECRAVRAVLAVLAVSAVSARLAVLAVLAALAALAACGVTGQPSGTATGASAPAPAHVTRDIEFSDCMRSHGVPSFPDPTANGGIELPPNLNPQAPAFRSAKRACASLLPNKGAPPATPAGERSAAVEFARCMRAHGVPQFPDPAFTSPRTAARVLVLGTAVFAISPSVNPDSPAFHRAANTCGLASL